MSFIKPFFHCRKAGLTRGGYCINNQITGHDETAFSQHMVDNPLVLNANINSISAKSWHG
jgi:hypothetical protein